MKIWGIDFPDTSLDVSTSDYLRTLPKERPTVEWVWAEMDRVWHSLNLSNVSPYLSESMGVYYSHPVWTMNGIFTLADPVSRGHRQSIAGFLKSQNCISVADFGGGFGALAKEIVRQNICASAYVIEPYPSPLALALTGEVQRVKFVSDLTDAAPYDALIAQDVLEHVEDPVGLVSRLVLSVLPGGLIIFANCFYPVIQCHLPATFHLRHTFVCIMRYFGLEYLTRVPGAEHALIFRRKRKLNMNLVRRSERFSQLLGPIVNATLPMLSKIARRLRNQ